MLSIFHYQSIKGNLMTLAMIFGACQGSGVFISGGMIKFCNDKTTYYVAICFICITSALLAFSEHYNQNLVYLFLFLQVFSVGSVQNLSYNFQATRIDPKLYSASHEFNFRLSMLISFAAPILTTYGRFVVLTVQLLFCLLGVIVVRQIGQRYKTQKMLESIQANLKDQFNDRFKDIKLK